MYQILVTWTDVLRLNQHAKACTAETLDEKTKLDSSKAPSYLVACNNLEKTCRLRF